MRTILFWLLPIYNLVTAIALVRRVAFPAAPEGGNGRPIVIVGLAWVLVIVAAANILVIRRPAFMAVPYILFAAIALMSWRLNAKAPRRTASAGDAS